MHKRKIIRCEFFSPLYKEIVNSKNNGKVLEDGKIRIGNDYYLDPKKSIVEKFK